MNDDTPPLSIGDFALLKIVAIDAVGAFLDWGLPKDLFLPFSEQVNQPCVGDEVLIFVYLDNNQRFTASMKLNKNIDKSPGEYSEDQEVQLLIAEQTPLGFKAIVENRHWGMLYKDQVFKPIHYGQKLTGYIRAIREDNKLDLSLSKTGHKAAEPIAEKILQLLKSNAGFFKINEKTAPEKIYELFGVSKKQYKIALGGLYKKRQIVITEDGIQLTDKQPK